MTLMLLFNVPLLNSGDGVSIVHLMCLSFVITLISYEYNMLL